MNKNIFSKIALMAGVALMGVGCQTDYFNDHYLPGYENGGTITDSKNFELVLSADDYAAIAKNSTNKAIAEEAGEEAANISINPRMLGLYDGDRIVRDLWRQKDVGTLTSDRGERFTTLVPAHGVALVKVSPGNSDKQYTGKVTYASSKK